MLSKSGILLFFALSIILALVQATPRSPAEILNYFRSIQGKGIMSGQFIERGPIDPIAQIHDSTGKWLGMIGGDYWWYGSGSFSADYSGFNAIAKNYWNDGGLITLSLSMANPTTGGGLNDLSRLNAGDILTPGTDTNKNFMSMVNSIADGLVDLQNSGVSVIFRPFHECNGNWFWWGTKFLAPNQFQAMWQFVHNHFTQNRGLRNLIWLYGGATLGFFPIRNYPGNSYVDMMGLDVYSNNPGPETADQFSFLQKTYPGKLLCLAEFGPTGPNGGNTTFQEPILIRQARQNLPMAVFFQQWWDKNSGGPGWGMASVQNAKEALNDPYTINRGQF